MNSVGFWFPYTPPILCNSIALSMSVSAGDLVSILGIKTRAAHTSQSKAMFLPKRRFIDAIPDDCFY
jgi:hypothetical protein